MSTNPTKVSTEVSLPADLSQALAAEPKAQAAWNELTSIGRRDFTSWITEAKQAETRSRRIQRCVENLIKGKRRPCCYAVVPMDFYKKLGEDAVAKERWSKLSADEKRDIKDWIEDAPDKGARASRIREACSSLAVGKRLGN